MPRALDPLPATAAAPPGRSRWQGFVDSRLLAVEAALLVAIARLLVKHVPFRHWRRWLVSAEPLDAAPPARRLPSVVHVARVVPRAAAMVPFDAVCLPQAMAGQWMLRRRGVPSRLSLGARRERPEETASAGGERNARPPRHLASRPIGDEGESGSGTKYHAWLCVGGQCVLGGPVDSYARLPPFDAIPPRARRRRAGSRT